MSSTIAEGQLPDVAAALALFERIPPRPGPEVDRVLDATERCIARFGVRRTSMTDIAREMGVARTTLYRQVASIEEALALVGSRQLFLFLDELVALLGDGDAARPQTFVDAVVRTVTLARSHPVGRRILGDEPELLGGAVTSGVLPGYVEQLIDLMSPVIANAMSTGSIRDGDPRLVAGVIVRLIAMCILVPPVDDLEPLVQCALEPVLQPPRRRRR